MLGFIQRYKLLILVAILVLVGALVYQFALVDEDGNLAFLSKDSNVSGSVIGKEIIGILSELNALDLSGDVFEDPVFSTLRDFQRGVSRKPIGRSNPFAPLGSSAGAVGFIELPLVKLGDSFPEVQQESNESDVVEQIENETKVSTSTPQL